MNSKIRDAYSLRSIGYIGSVNQSQVRIDIFSRLLSLRRIKEVNVRVTSRATKWLRNINFSSMYKSL